MHLGRYMIAAVCEKINSNFSFLAYFVCIYYSWQLKKLSATSGVIMEDRRILNL